MPEPKNKEGSSESDTKQKKPVKNVQISATENTKQDMDKDATDDGFESLSSYSVKTTLTRTTSGGGGGGGGGSGSNQQPSRQTSCSHVSSGNDTGIFTGLSGDLRDRTDGISSAGNSNCYMRCSSRPVHYAREVRLSVRQKTLSERHAEYVPFPESALPPISFPNWRDMGLDHKIPNIPAPDPTHILTRGQLGHPIAVTKQEYSLLDEYNRERTQSDTYNSLHDPHALGYLDKPNIRKILRKQRLINEKDQVICSLKEFNRHRTYLRTIYNQSLEKSIQIEYKQREREHEMEKSLKKHDSFTRSGAYNFVLAERRRQAREWVQEHREEILRNLEGKEERGSQAYCCFLANKMRERMDKSSAGEAKREMQRGRVAAVYRARACRAQELRLLIAAKDKAAQERISMNKKYAKEAYKHFIQMWYMSKYEQQEKHKKKHDEARASLRDENKSRAIERQSRVERYRDHIGTIQLARLRKVVRMWAMVRKYFHRWLDIVRAKRERRPDEKHQSLWDITSGLKDTVAYLSSETGHFKFDDFIMNILRFKSQIKAQLRMEAEEARREKNEELRENMGIRQLLVHTRSNIGLTDDPQSERNLFLGKIASSKTLNSMASLTHLLKESSSKGRITVGRLTSRISASVMAPKSNSQKSVSIKSTKRRSQQKQRRSRSKSLWRKRKHLKSIHASNSASKTVPLSKIAPTETETENDAHPHHSSTTRGSQGFY